MKSSLTLAREFFDAAEEARKRGEITLSGALMREAQEYYLAAKADLAKEAGDAVEGRSPEYVVSGSEL